MHIDGLTENLIVYPCSYGKICLSRPNENIHKRGPENSRSPCIDYIREYLGVLLSLKFHI